MYWLCSNQIIHSWFRILLLLFISFVVSSQSETASDEFVSGIVCKESEVDENGMKECALGSDGSKVLIVKQNGKIYALGTKCSHYGAPLAKGALGQGLLRCSWHGARYNISTGHIAEHPGLDDIPCYDVQVLPDGSVNVTAKKADLGAKRLVKKFGHKNPRIKKTFVVIGGGAAGACCVETLREEGYRGNLLMICEEPHLPYDRPRISKKLDVQLEKVQLRDEEFYKKHDIEVMREHVVSGIDTEKHHVFLTNGDMVKYDSLFIASGCRARKPGWGNFNLPNVFTLRTINDSKSILNALKPTSRVVVYGTSFTGMEAASFIVDKVANVTMVGYSAAPFEEAFSRKIGIRIAKLFTEHNVTLVMGDTIDLLEGAGKLQFVKLISGRRLPADILVVAIGTAPNTDFLRDSGIRKHHDGSIIVDKYLKTNRKNIYAGGDVAWAPIPLPLPNTDYKSASIAHWQIAQTHGRVAALNMLGKQTAVHTAPFFWTVLFGKSFRYTGYAAGFNDLIIVGDLEDLKFAAFYCVDNYVTAVLTAGYDPIAAKFADFLVAGQLLLKSDLRKNGMKWAERNYNSSQH